MKTQVPSGVRRHCRVGAAARQECGEGNLDAALLTDTERKSAWRRWRKLAEMRENADAAPPLQGADRSEDLGRPLGFEA